MKNLDSFKNARVLVVGDVMLDRYWWGTVDRISPEAPVPVVRLERTTAAPGGAANVAVNVAALGGTPVLIGCTGDDAEADELRASLREEGVVADHLIKIGSRRTTVKTRIVAHNQQVARIDSEDASTITEDESARVCESVSAALRQIDVAIVSDYAKGFLSRSVLSEVIKACKNAGKTVLVDPKGKDFSKYAGATILTPNRREAAEACKLDESHPEMVKTAGAILLRDFDFKNVLITEGEHGMTLLGTGDAFHIDAAAHQVFDVTGAGDTVIATLGVAIAAGFDLRSSVELANTAAGISVGKVGASSVTAEMLPSGSDVSKAVIQNG